METEPGSIEDAAKTFYVAIATGIGNHGIVAHPGTPLMDETPEILYGLVYDSHFYRAVFTTKIDNQLRLLEEQNTDAVIEKWFARVRARLVD